MTPAVDGLLWRSGTKGAHGDPRIFTTRHVSIRPNQHRGWGSDGPECRKLPRTVVCRIDEPNPIGPRSDIDAAGLTQVEEHRPCRVQQAEGAQRAVRGYQIEV